MKPRPAKALRIDNARVTERTPSPAPRFSVPGMSAFRVMPLPYQVTIVSSGETHFVR
jgi:hypothetical protein